MDMKKALRIQELRTGPVEHSLRAISTIIEKEFPEFPELSGNQMHGRDLVQDAMEKTYNKPLSKIDDKIRDEWDR